MATTRTVQSRPRRGRRVVATILLTIGMFIVALLPVGWNNRDDELEMAEYRAENASQAFIDGDRATAFEEEAAADSHEGRAETIAGEMFIAAGLALLFLVPGTLLWRGSHRPHPAG